MASTNSTRTFSGCRSATRSRGARTMMQRRFVFAASLGCALLVAACENEVLNSPRVPAYQGGTMFQRYVAMGNSITAGFQSGGINDSTQRQSYAVLIGGAMRSPFFSPLLGKPGCPPP